MPYKNAEDRKKNKREYMRKYTRDRYAKDPAFRQSVINKGKKRQKVFLAALDPVILAFKKNGCLFCKEPDVVCLAAHHVDPKQKDFNISSLRYGSRNIERTIEKLTNELRKCVCLCMNCHAKVHAGKLTLEGNY